MDSDKYKVFDQISIKLVAKEQFSNLYKDPRTCQIDDQLKIVKLFPSYFSTEDGLDIYRFITLKEVEATLEVFAKDKILGPDDWTVKFFLKFLDLLGPELVEAIEDTRVSGVNLEELKKTYLTLIPKVDRPTSFADYRPIALCNLLYKLITKIIVEQLKAFLREFVSPEQFDFLLNRQILDVVGIIKEALHTINSKRTSVAILKLDLEKEYNKVNWTMLRLTLLQIGLPFEVVRWVMSCVTSDNFPVLLMDHPLLFSKDRGASARDFIYFPIYFC